MKYKLLALDVDGTLVGTDGVVDGDVAAAVRQARAAGLAVCLATGRSYIETVGIWRQLNLEAPFEPLVLIGGALVSEPDTGRSLYHRTIPFDAACAFDQALAEAGYCAMAITDPWRVGFDYILTDGANLPDAERRWFAQMSVKVRRVRRLADVPDPPPLLRISAVTDPDTGPALAAALAVQFAGRLNIHSILAPNYGVTVVEAFAAEASKLAAVRYVAQSLPVAVARVAAVGDDVNDLPLLAGVGLGVVMPQAPPEVAAAARHVAAEGLAAFIRDLAAGRFDADNAPPEG